MLLLSRRIFGSNIMYKRFHGSATNLNRSAVKLANNFKVIKEDYIKELDIYGTKYLHLPTGATLVHLSKKDDRNCAFSVGFRTFPSDSTGVAHILEHTVLCGSTKYPVRDPFFKMLNRSLASYMNAWTSSDWTMYPFTTQNIQDYHNLRSVYFDAVFNPLLNENDFRQEGWRLEKSNSSGGGWEIKGVVFNEMKGALSDNESLFSTRQQQKMFPGTVYENVSGGDPLHIPTLTHEGLKEFHQKCYNPANSLFFSYGNLDINEHALFLDKELSKVKRTMTLSSDDPVAGLRRFNEPARHVESCSPDPMGDPNRQAKVLISFLANDVSDIQTTFNMKILSSLLFDGPSSPMYKALIDSNIGTEYAPGTGYDPSTKAATINVGLQGISFDDVDRIQDITFQTLERAQREGFDKSRVDSILHQIELGIKYHSTNFGLGLAQMTTSAFVHNVCPLDIIKVSEKISLFKKQYSSGGLFESLIDKFMLKNRHRLTFIMKPDIKFKEAQLEKEVELTKRLAENVEEDIDQKNKELKKSQEENQPQLKNLLPCLNLNDVSTKLPLANPFAIDHRDGMLRYHRASTKSNGIGYFKCKLPFDKSNLSENDILMLPLLSSALTELGTSNRSIDEFDRQLKMHSGGLSVSILIDRDASLSLIFSSFALGSDNLQKTFELFNEALTQTNWTDYSRLKTLLNSMSSSLMNSISSNGQSFAISMAAASLSSDYRRLKETLGGLTQVKWLSRQLEINNIEGLSKDLKCLSEKIFKGNEVTPSVLTISDSSSLNEILLGRGITLIKSLKGKHASFDSLKIDGVKEISYNPSNYAIPMPFSTNFIGKAIQTDNKDIPLSANLSILSKLLPPLHLHRELREKNGAYGGGSSYSSFDGLFNFYTYRDPHPINSINIIDSALDWFDAANINDQDLLEAKLSAFSEIDSPVDLSNEGLHHFKYGITDAERQSYRDALFKVDLKTIKESAQYLKRLPSSVVAIIEGRLINDFKDKSYKIEEEF